jgi:hypothetical protein
MSFFRLSLLALAAVVATDARATDADFRLLWFLIHEAGGVQQQEQWNIACASRQCTISRAFSGKEIGSREIPSLRAHELLKAAETLPTASKSVTGTGFPVEEIRVSQEKKQWAKYRPAVSETGDMSISFAWTNFELALRHAWDGRTR